MDTCCWKMKRFQSAYQKLKSQQDLYKKTAIGLGQPYIYI